MTNADSNAVLALLRGLNPPLRVHDSYVTDSDAITQTISASLPYVVFYGSPDDASLGDTLAGTSGARLVEFRLVFVGETREQAALVGERARAALDRKFVTFPAGQRFVRVTDNSAAIARDDTWTCPGGRPLFSGSDQYSVGI